SISERGYRMSQAGSSCSTMCSYQPHQRREFFTLVQRLSSYRHTRVMCHGHPPCQRFGYYWLCSHHCSPAFHCLISSSAWIAISGLSSATGTTSVTSSGTTSSPAESRAPATTQSTVASIAVRPSVVIGRDP